MFVLLSGAAAGAVEIPDGFRQPPYKAATPQAVPGASTLSTPDAEALHAQGAAFVDVSPLTLGTYGAMRGRWIVQAAHETIPGALWLPNVGLADPPPELAAWFRAHLERLSGPAHARPVVLFCTLDCWMSWNAVRRAVLWGFANVSWYREGIDGWRDALLPVETAQPAALSPGADSEAR